MSCLCCALQRVTNRSIFYRTSVMFNPKLISRNTGRRFVANRWFKDRNEMLDIYNTKNPMLFYEYFSALDYEENHNTFVHMSKEILLPKILNIRTRNNNEKMRIIEFGSSYGNSSLGLREHLEWRDIGNIWRNDIQPPLKNPFFLSAVDSSMNALEYGQHYGYFDEIFCCDFNVQPFSNDLQHAISNADIMSCILCTAYFRENTFKFLLDLFLKERSKEKLLFYSIIPALDASAVHSYIPEILLKKYENWIVVDSIFCKHRYFSDEEKVKFNGNKESWMWYFAIQINEQ